MDRQKVLDYINKKYKVQPEYPWRTSPNSAVFRHSDNNKWFALLMDIPGDKVGLPTADYVDVINLKSDDMIFRDMIIQEAGIMPAYHMNKMHWVSVLLDGTVPENKVLDLIDMSFLATASTKKKRKSARLKSGSFRRTRSTMMSYMPLKKRISSTGSRAPGSKKGIPSICT